MKFFKRKYVFAIFYTVLLTMFTTYIAMDTFALKKEYKKIENNSLNEQILEDNNNKIITENSYKDENISIKINEYREYDTTIYVADIKVNDIKYLKTALANNTYGKNITEKTSTMSTNNNAILAINGDFYGAQEKGFVLKNGVVYRETSSSS